LLVGSWKVQERIGSGSHGVVFRAVPADKPEAGSYALKLALEPGDARFEREAWLLSRVHHPSVPRLEDTGSWTSPYGEAYPYVVMRRVEGLSLYAWAQEYGLTLRQAISQLAQVARALEAIHRHGVHRDVKGGNIRVSAKGHAVLLDFGSCWYPDAAPLTDNAMPPGTGPYRSPQMIFFGYALGHGFRGYYESRAADDVYSLGVTAYRLLSGTYPANDPGPEGGATKAVRPVAPKGLDEACPELSALILRMLSEDPEARGSAKQVAEELERLLEQRRPALDRPWVSNASRQPTEKVRRLVPLWYALRERAPRLALAGIFIALGLLCVLPRTADRAEVASAESQGKPKAAEKPDAGTGAMGEEAMASVAPAQTAPVSPGKIMREMPTEPLPRQKRPPCNYRAAVVLNGGCWRRIDAATAPCEAEDEYEHQGRCYYPLFGSNAERVPTSEEPK
jgi:serine/threonine protein kinase